MKAVRLVIHHIQIIRQRVDLQNGRAIRTGRPPAEANGEPGTSTKYPSGYWLVSQIDGRAGLVLLQIA